MEVQEAAGAARGRGGGGWRGDGKAPNGEVGPRFSQVPLAAALTTVRGMTVRDRNGEPRCHEPSKEWGCLEMARPRETLNSGGDSSLQGLTGCAGLG